MKVGVIDLLAAHRAKTFLMRAWATIKALLNLLFAMATRLFDERAAQFFGTA